MFSVLTSKIFGGVSIALALALATLYVSKQTEIHSLNKQIEDPKNGYRARLQRAELNYATAQVNEDELKAGLAQCNAGAAATAATADRINAAGVAAINEVKRASAAPAKIAKINAMPQSTCDDALKILKAGG